MQIPGAGEKGRDSSNFVAAEDAGNSPTMPPTCSRGRSASSGTQQHGTDVDRATLTLCRLRRARAGERGGPGAGDEAVRAVLSTASPAALLWLASRAISYMDESGFPEAVEPWFRDEWAQDF